MATPRCLRESVERDFQVTATVALWWRQPTPCEVYLEGRQHQRRHREAPIALRAELDELSFLAVLQLQNALNGPPELPSITSREIGSRRPRIGHEEGIVNEGRVPHDVGNRAEV